MKAKVLIFHNSVSTLCEYTNNFDLLTLEIDLLFENFYFVNNNGIVSARALIFYMIISSNITFPWKPRFLTL